MATPSPSSSRPASRSAMSESRERQLHQPVERNLDDRFDLSEMAQAVTLLGGGLLLAKGLTSRRIVGLPMALAGFAIAWRAARGYFGWDRTHQAVGVRARRGFQLKTAITFQCPPEQIYQKWRDLENLPKLLGHLSSVQQLEGTRSHWVAKGPLGPVVWDAEVINERENELLAWRSVPGSQLATAGSIHLEPMSNDRGTILRISLKYDPPGGQIAAIVASLFGQGFEQSVRDDLRRFKQLMETGEIARTAGQPQGSCASRDGRRS